MKKFIREKAFTLVEMLVVVVIIGVLTTMVLASYNSGKKQLALQRAANKLAQDIRRAEEMAMANTRAPGCFKITDPNEPKFQNEYYYGFGLAFSTDDSPQGGKPDNPYKYRYILFADCKGDYIYNRAQDDDSPLDSVDFASVEISSQSNGFNTLEIVFTPPDPSVSLKINGSNVDQASITIRLRDDPTKTKTISINRVGLIEIQ